jgi:hypothetical protein
MFRHVAPHRFGTFERLWESTLRPLLEAADARNALEIGSDQGDLTRLLTHFCAERGGKAHIIDPSPAFHPRTLSAELGEAFVFHQAPSVDVLGSLPHVDAVLIDGDHNWHTVMCELRILSARSPEAAAFPLIILHDTGWPYGRRDMYYMPERIPASERQPYDRLGMQIDSSHLKHGGLNQDFCNARHEGGPRNGVRTAIEDFLQEAPYPLTFQHLPGVHGIGILASHARLATSPVLAELLASLRPSSELEKHLEAIERDRLILEIRTQERERTLEMIRTENARLRSIIHNRTHTDVRIQELQQELDHLRRTKSWKITAPLRRLEKFLRDSR